MEFDFTILDPLGKVIQNEKIDTLIPHIVNSDLE